MLHFLPLIPLVIEAIPHETIFSKNFECLSIAVFEEAGAELIEGQVAVADVVLRRAALQKKTVCSIISQPRQFSFYKDGLEVSKIPKNVKLTAAKRLLRFELQIWTSSIGSATHFHNASVKPSWSNSKGFVFIKKIGNHYFYKQA